MFRYFFFLVDVPSSPILRDQGPTWLSLAKCLTRNPGVLGSSRGGSSGFFRGSVLGQDTSEPSLVLVKPMKDMNNVICRRDMNEILLKAALDTIQSINHT